MTADFSSLGLDKGHTGRAAAPSPHPIPQGDSSHTRPIPNVSINSNVCFSRGHPKWFQKHSRKAGRGFQPQIDNSRLFFSNSDAPSNLSWLIWAFQSMFHHTGGGGTSLMTPTPSPVVPTAKASNAQRTNIPLMKLYLIYRIFPMSRVQFHRQV